MAHYVIPNDIRRLHDLFHRIREMGPDERAALDPEHVAKVEAAYASMRSPEYVEKIAALQKKLGLGGAA
jgi:hypothetical protein